jgi:membrane-associated phospholipid phosphatase
LKRPIAESIHRAIGKRPWTSTAYIVTMPLIAGAVGLPINATAVRGRYEWFGLLRILGDVSHRTGFWMLCLMVWLVGLNHAPVGYRVGTTARRQLGVWAAITVGILSVLRMAPTLLQAGSVADEVACAVLLPGLTLHIVATPGGWPERRHRALSTLLAATWTFLGCTLIAFGHTMFKGALFSICSPVDALLMKLDAILLGPQFYQHLSHWRSVSHPQITRGLDIVYVELFEQLWWSFLFFFGSRDYLSGRRYILATFAAYLLGPACYFIAPSLGPIFHRPELFADIRNLAPDSAYLAQFLADQTRLTQTGVPHQIAPFGFVAAFPSLHVSLALIVMFAMRRSLVMTLFNGLGVLVTVVATVVLGWHYLVDGIFGAILGVFCWWFAVRVTALDGKRPIKDSIAG